MKLSNKTLLNLTHGVISYKEKPNAILAFIVFLKNKLNILNLTLSFMIDVNFNLQLL